MNAVTTIGAGLLGLGLLAGCATSGSSSGPPPQLAGTHWTVTRIDGSAPLRGDALTADFGADGRINGNSGCNGFSGPFIQTGSELDIGELLSTRRACTDSDRQRQESRVLTLLQGAESARMDDGNLVLRSPSGSIEFAPVSHTAAGYPRRVQYDCDGVGLTVAFQSGSADLTWSDGRDVLTQRPAASGFWYESSRNSIRGKDELTWTQDGRPARSCKELR